MMHNLYQNGVPKYTKIIKRGLGVHRTILKLARLRSITLAWMTMALKSLPGTLRNRFWKAFATILEAFSTISQQSSTEGPANIFPVVDLCKQRLLNT